MCRSTEEGFRRCATTPHERSGHNARRVANRAMKRAAVAWAQENLSPEATQRINAATDAASRQVAIDEGVPAHLVHPAIGDKTPPPPVKVQLASLAAYHFQPAGSLRSDPDDDTLDKQCFSSKLWAQALTDEQYEAVQDYTANDYDVVNRALERGAADSLPEEYRELITALDAALDMAGTSGEPRMAYRGVRVPEDWTADEVRERIAEAFPTGATADFKTYLSTSLKPSVAAEFSRGAIPVMYEMKSRRGANLEEMSDMPGEHEILFGRDTRWRVAGVSTAARTVRGDMDGFDETDAVIIHFVEEAEAAGDSAGGAPGLAPVRREPDQPVSSEHASVLTCE